MQEKHETLTLVYMVGGATVLNLTKICKLKKIIKIIIKAKIILSSIEALEIQMLVCLSVGLSVCLEHFTFRLA